MNASDAAQNADNLAALRDAQLSQGLSDSARESNAQWLALLAQGSDDFGSDWLAARF